ncbi:MAG: tRNA pseudouridine(38-40) synthase TruA [Bacilli bacterium]
MRLKGVISYKGTNFYGYQIQKDIAQRSVQKEIQDVLKRIFNSEIKIYSSGRTDRGVHALNQVVHFDIDREVDAYKLKHSLNCLLPSDIHFISLEIVDETFHARFSCTRKEYRYVINLGEYMPITNDIMYNYCFSLNLDKIKEAMKLFVGKHNFINFCANDDGDYEREIYSFTLEEKEDIIIFKIQGNGFRRYMVRMIIGTLIEIGKDKLELSELKNLIDGKNYNRVSFKVPSEGLYLYKVYYEEKGGKGEYEDD